MKLLSTLFLLALSASAQTLAPAPVVPSPVVLPAPVFPSYMLSFGGGYTRANSAPGIPEGWVSGAFGLGGGNYLCTSIDFFSATSTIREGYAKIFAQSGNFIIGGRIDAGVSASAPVIGSFAGGAFMLYDLKGWNKRLAGMKLVAEIRVTGATATSTTSTTGGVTTVTTVTTSSGSTVTPGFFFGFGKTF